MKQKVSGSLCCGFVTRLHPLKWNVGCCKKLRIAKSWDRKNFICTVRSFFCILWPKYIWCSSHLGQYMKRWIHFSENEYKTLLEMIIRKMSRPWKVVFTPLLNLIRCSLQIHRAEIAITCCRRPFNLYAVFSRITFKPNLVSSHHDSPSPHIKLLHFSSWWFLPFDFNAMNLDLNIYSKTWLKNAPNTLI